MRRQLAQFVVDSGNSCSAACGSPCSMADRMRVTSLIVLHAWSSETGPGEYNSADRRNRTTGGHEFHACQDGLTTAGWTSREVGSRSAVFVSQLVAAICVVGDPGGSPQRLNADN